MFIYINTEYWLEYSFKGVFQRFRILYQKTIHILSNLHENGQLHIVFSFLVTLM